MSWWRWLRSGTPRTGRRWGSPRTAPGIRWDRRERTSCEPPSVSLRGGRGDLRDWIGEHLDPLEALDPAEPGPMASDFDLSKGYGPAEVDGPLTPAAVLIGLVERDHGLSVILTRRADTLRRHTGQVALPGGRRDPGETPWQTALREAHEEIGLEPHFVDVAGLSTAYRTGTGYLI